MRAAYLEHGRGIGARHPLGARCIDAQPTWGAGPSAAGSKPAEAWSRLGRGTY